MTGKKILIIEDNVLNLELTSDLLLAHGFTVASAQTAEEGLRLAAEILPDLVLMDWGLPGMDGLTATKQLRANPVTCHLTVVGLTAHAMKGDDENALIAGCDGYLTKPVDTRTLIETITRFIALTPLLQTSQNPSEIKHYAR
ncbi:MAG: two-component response regulator [Pedosphaera sp.]|nr:two-component response regulator [Pedosphaera sp.]